MMSSSPPPSAEQQLAFLSKLQRLFNEADFTATYKFALIITLADLAVELGADDGSELVVTTRQLGHHFIELYWRHSLPYSSVRQGAQAGVLLQNVGSQAAVISAIGKFRSLTGSQSLSSARRHVAYPRLLAEVTQTVAAQPLKYLQNYGGSTDSFIYERVETGKVRLLPGVPYCLRRFHPLVQQLSRSHWVNHIKRNSRNLTFLGEAGDLEDFLFSSTRQSLALVGERLRKLDGDKCFYCQGKLAEHDVDHFIPFSLYPRDLIHNFVLAHSTCNRSKSDTLAGRNHLERWLERMVRSADALSEVGEAAGVLGDSQTIHKVAAWGYVSACASSASAWVAPSSYETVDSSYTALLQ